MRKLLVAIGLVIGALGAPAVSHAAPIQLAVAIDGSGSMSASDWSLQTNGLANAVMNVIGGLPDNSVELSVVVFSSGASTPINHVLVNAGNLASLVGTISGLAQPGGGTNFDAAVTAMLNAITSSPNYDPNNRQVMNISTDGFGSFNTAAQHTALTNAGIDLLGAEAVGAGANVSFLQNSVVFPTPGYVAPPFSGNNGFVVSVNNFSQYEAAITEKLQFVVGAQVPEPSTFAIFGIFLALGAGCWFYRRQRATAASVA